LSQQGSNNDLLCHYCPKHSAINLLRVNEEGDETSEEGFDRDGNAGITATGMTAMDMAVMVHISRIIL
jgi:hypothetical protein